MSKTLFTAALAFVLSIGGFVVSAQAEDLSTSTDPIPWSLVISAKDDVLLQKGLASIASKSGKDFGYKVNGDGGFTSLSDAIKNAEAKRAADGDKVSATINLDNFSSDTQIDFGYGDEAGFDSVLSVSGDAGFHAGYNTNGFYHLDFPKDPYDGTIEILVMGEPLPASTVTLLVALAAAAGLLLYNNRRTRARFSAQA